MKTALLKTLLVTLLFCAPWGALASVEITEVMYDAPGSDSGHEWIEISTDSAVDLRGYKLFEGGTNHNLSVVAGTSSLAAGEVAIISNNSQNFLADFPNYKGTLYKSSFSLSNTGESISIRDTKLVDVVSLSYSSGAADGDGNSLHLNAGSWIPGAPNPGSLAATKAIVKPAAPAKTTAVKKTSAKSTSSNVTNSDTNASQSAAVANFDQPISPVPQNNLLWTGLGLAALIVLGVGGVIHVRNTSPVSKNLNEELTADEFEIVG